MVRRVLRFLVVSAGISTCVALASAREARADDAVVVVQDARFAEPPTPGEGQPIVPIDEPRDRDRERRESHDYDRYEHHRSPVRLALGPSFLTTGKGVGVGLGLGIEFGSGVVGGRIGATWLRGEGDKNGVPTPTGNAVGHYVGELTLDILKRGSFHPVVAVGGGILHVSRSDVNGVVAVGTVRASLEYFAPIEEADVRIGIDATGGLAGPGADQLSDLKGYGLFGAHAAFGF